jgi:hypothetical protein
MLTLFYGCVLLLRETRLALRAVDSETAFVLELNEMYRRQPDPASGSGSDSSSGRSSV